MGAMLLLPTSLSTQPPFDQLAPLEREMERVEQQRDEARSSSKTERARELTRRLELLQRVHDRAVTIITSRFDLCLARGLTGGQGVLIPASNVKHLMLHHRVTDAVHAGQFHVYPIETIDQGIEILTGMPAGERDLSGQFPVGSINHQVERRLIELAHTRQTFGTPGRLEFAG